MTLKKCNFMVNLDGNYFMIFNKRHRLKHKGNTKYLKAVIKKVTNTFKDHLHKIKINNIRKKVTKIIKRKMNKSNHIKRNKLLQQQWLTKK